jgi:hypothetical protein
MRRIATVLAGGLIAAVAISSAFAQAAPSVGSPVKDAKGQAIGVIEKVVFAAGKPRQVQVRQGSVLRTLPVDGLTAQNGGYVTVLTKAEFEALPGTN